MSAQTNLAYDYPVLGFFWSMLVLFLWIMWFILLFRVIVDIFRDDDLGGWGKAGWTIFVCILPFLGVFVYLIARGKGMGKREMEHARAQQQAVDSYIRQTALGGAGTSSVDELAKLSEMRSRGDITNEEFTRAKELVLAGRSPSEAAGATPSASPS
ncbi:SHOCT domain-containing protein [Streptomyces sp. 5-8]|uniref:SHOCT domain-containing protein n=1 Tax=Streptomyces musisoli TaxID=2802280 RepID=A0ABS1NWV2_9ACTN|nr:MULTISPECIES: SHOCT domain-containing protein [Streptomyces]MBL1104573.1 SHOCT domain-containing protein [Streptomyces musisoli]MBY8840546.1 SHOCT domain-containing protein [Streptomyces sp. SP2-10]